ncbi:hypothetical protein QEH56_15050 [Pelagicoccus enzymogenes]|uniref:hypothetical protein n=1 Tax=Pelagicoccus enzymogenes TaxID=2773457 RepID=UPI00280D3877|nr:hypothetical protein [Pelagicoccus enzymogenes]MDQ8199482.1 hypothetical protein [Pelagicoccus enzymogenes]
MPRSKYPPLRYAYASILSLLALLGTTATPVERNLRGIPYYNVFTARDFDSGASPVFVTTDSGGTVSYGDRNWISLYDGTTWHKV